MAVACENIVWFVLEMMYSQLDGIVPGDCIPILSVVAIIACMSSEVWGKAARVYLDEANGWSESSG